MQCDKYKQTAHEQPFWFSIGFLFNSTVILDGGKDTNIHSSPKGKQIRCLMYQFHCF